MKTEGIIRADSCYRLDAFQGESGLQTGALRQARREGLRVHRFSRRAYILGSDWIEFLKKASEKNEKND